MPLIRYKGVILRRAGTLASSRDCCCGTFFPCCSSSNVTIESGLAFAITDDDPAVLSNGWVLISETPRPDGKLDVHCFTVACYEPKGPGYFYIVTIPGTLDPATGQVQCAGVFIAAVESFDGSTITLEGENGDDLSGRYYITATCEVQTRCSWEAQRNTDGDLNWVQTSGADCLPPDFPPTVEGQLVVQ